MIESENYFSIVNELIDPDNDQDWKHKKKINNQPDNIYFW